MKLHFICSAAALAALSFCITAGAHAQIRAITFTLDSGDDYEHVEHTLGSQNLESVIQLQGTVFEDFLDAGSNQMVPLTPQKTGLAGEQTFTGMSSDFSPWKGTMTAVVDLGSGKFQLTGGDNLEAKITGLYCPDAFPTHEGANDGAACPTEGEAQYGFTLPVGAGSIEAATRDLLANLTGPSNIVGTEIDTLNWHLFFLRSNSDFDDAGGLDGLYDTGTLVVPEPGQEPLVGHNENDPGAGVDSVDESTFYKGTFTQDGTNASILIPIHLAYFIPTTTADDDGDGITNDYVRVILDGELKGDGALGATLTPGDFNQDGEVNGLDVNIYSRHIGTGEDHTHTPNQLEPPLINGVPHPHYALWTTGDANFDSIADDADLAIVAANFAPGGAGSGAGAPVPEPGSLVLAAMALFGLLQFRPTRGRTIRQ